ncbi:uncharacterized protein [Solanum lycopersicum]|uniref:uncharacterized protein n=1 Tax=Solanum lycopersicum TaxID=4081 RepID=UPI0037496D0D
MAGNLADERFRPPDPPLEAGNPTVHSTIHEVVEEASSTSSQLREEAVQIATVDADIDASRQNIEKGHNIRSNEGAIQRVEEQMEVGKIASQESAQEAAKLIHTPGQSEGNRQETSTGELSPVRELNTQQIGVGMEVQNVESRQEGERVVSQQRVQEQRNRDGQQQQVHRSVQNPQCTPQLNKEKEINQQIQRPTRFQGSREAIHLSKNIQNAMPSSELAIKADNCQGENITDGRWQKIGYDSIPDYCFYCKHQGHKESNCIIKQRDEDNKKRKELEKNKPRKDTAQNTNADLQIAKEMETCRIETVYNQQRHHNVDNQHQVIEDEWQTQKRRNGNQQTRRDADINSQRNEDRQGHQQ